LVVLTTAKKGCLVWREVGEFQNWRGFKKVEKQVTDSLKPFLPSVAEREGHEGGKTSSAKKGEKRRTHDKGGHSVTVKTTKMDSLRGHGSIRRLEN